MDHTDEWRRNWRTNWLSSIQEFADANTQRRLWLDRTQTNPHFSFVEYMCSYFDDLGLWDGGYKSALNRQFVTPEEVDAVTEFHSLLDAYVGPTDEYDHDAILKDSKWIEVQNAAYGAQLALKGLIHDPRELRLLMEP